MGEDVTVRYMVEKDLGERKAVVTHRILQIQPDENGDSQSMSKGSRQNRL